MVNSKKEILRLKQWEIVIKSQIDEIVKNKKINQIIFYTISLNNGGE